MAKCWGRVAARTSGPGLGSQEIADEVALVNISETQNGMKAEAKQHLRNVVSLDPDSEFGRQAAEQLKSLGD